MSTSSTRGHGGRPGWLRLVVLLVTLTLLLPAFLALPVAQPVLADQVVDDRALLIYGVSQQDLTGDTRPDLTIIDAAFATARDRILVYDQGGDMRSSTDWTEATDFANDVWIYDIGAQGRASLIVVYRLEGEQQVAYVYDTTGDKAQVAYTVDGATVTLDGSPFWTARIVSESTWFRPDGHLNLDVHMYFDGPIAALDRMPEPYRTSTLLQDGIPDVEFESVAGADGIARYGLLRLLAPFPPQMGFQRTGLFVNEGRYRTSPYTNAFFPFLPVPIDTSLPAYAHARYFDLPPLVAVDWWRGRVASVGLQGYPIGAGYHHNNNIFLQKGEVNDVDFESPQAYYDFAGEHDAYPELHIRFFNYPPRDPYLERPWNAMGDYVEDVSYDWTIFDTETLAWDFKVGLAGNVPIDGVIRFPDFAVRAIPYHDLPGWIVGQEWKLQTFVAREGIGYPSSEGIYQWGPLQGADPTDPRNPTAEVEEHALAYMYGLTAEPPAAYFDSIIEGYRAEHNFTHPGPPRLYWSPVDRRLHLLNAEAGVWNVDGRHTIRYANLGGAHINDWRYAEGDTTLKRLSVVAGQGIYTEGDLVVLQAVPAPPATFEAPPP
ncbi:MAG: hypothetical protein ACRDI2_09195, partial [Chloroflexota bacterium]